MRQAVAQVHHEIELARAEDPDTERIRDALGAGVTKAGLRRGDADARGRHLRAPD
jgi:hypothetical protein